MENSKSPLFLMDRTKRFLVYFVGSDNPAFVKIDHCKSNFASRVKQIQNGCPFPITPIGILYIDRSLKLKFPMKSLINPLILLKFIIRYLTFHSYAVGPTAASLPPGATPMLLDQDSVVQQEVSIYVDPVTHLTSSQSVHVRVKLVEQ